MRDQDPPFQTHLGELECVLSHVQSSLGQVGVNPCVQLRLRQVGVHPHV